MGKQEGKLIAKCFSSVLFGEHHEGTKELIQGVAELCDANIAGCRKSCCDAVAGLLDKLQGNIASSGEVDSLHRSTEDILARLQEVEAAVSTNAKPPTPRVRHAQPVVILHWHPQRTLLKLQPSPRWCLPSSQIFRKGR